MPADFTEFFELNPFLIGGRQLQKLSRHLALRCWTPEFQKKLDDLRILVVGAGGLGSTLCLELSGCLFENKALTIIDPDHVDITNLHRQIAFTEADAGLPKATRLAEVCRARNRDCNVEAVVSALTPENASAYIGSHDVVFDCTDNVFTRILISDTWAALGRTNLVISASCVGWCGQVVSLSRTTPFCLRCLYGDPGERQGCDRLGQCAIQGVMGPVVSAIATLQLMELVNILRFQDSKSRLQIFEFNGNFIKRDLEIHPSCSTCTGLRNRMAEVISYQEALQGDEIDGETFRSHLDAGRCKVIDVRERNHHSCSRLKDSISVPASEFLHTGHDLRQDEQFNRILSDIADSEIVVVVCRRGIDSLKLVSRVQKLWPKKRFFSLSRGLTGLGVDIV